MRRFSITAGAASIAESLARWLRRWSAADEPEPADTLEFISPVFRLDDVWKSYTTAAGSRYVLRGVTAEIGPGLTCILGPSGHGKSTLLNVLGGLTTPDCGDIWLRGEKLPADEAGLRLLRAWSVGWVFQTNNLLGHLTAKGNVALPLFLRGAPADEAAEAARHALEQVRLGELADRLPRQLSGGEMQRVAIARALVAKPSVVLADEPTGNLDPDTADAVMAAFADSIAFHGTPVVMVTHDEPLAYRYADQIFRCHKGELTLEESRAKPAARPAPVGTALVLRTADDAS